MPVPFSRTLMAGAALLVGASTALAETAPVVVTSIKPVHSLVAGVMDGAGEPHLLVRGAGSPHTYAMRPSDAQALSRATAVFWIGPDLEVFLEAPLENLAGAARVVTLMEAPGLVIHEYGDDHGHSHGHGGDDRGHDHAHGHHDHDHTGPDPHVWLDPHNATAMVEAIATALADVDPDNAGTYRSNAGTLMAGLDALDADLSERLSGHGDVPFYTFHEAFRYFAERYDLDARGAIAINPEVQPGAQRIAEIRREIGADEEVCLLAEAQFPPRLIAVLAEGTQARTGVVDPLGAELDDGPGLYETLMRANADAFVECLGGER